MPDLSNVQALATSQHGVVSRLQAVECGLTSRQIANLIRRGQWRRLRTGIYLVRGDPAPALAARVMAVQLAYGPRAVAVGPTAAPQGLLSGPGYEHVHVTVPGRSSAAPMGLRLHGWDVTPGETTLYKGIRLSTPGRTLRDTVLLADRYAAVSVIDSALQQGLVNPEDLAELEAANAGRLGASRTRPWWSQADGRSQSTFETRIRLICADAGIPPETLQHPVYDSQGHLAGHADLAWPSHGVIVEADGRDPHSLPGALFTDRHRQNRIVSSPDRLVLLRFTWSDLQHPREIVTMIRSALEAPDPT
ncbi:type IV toxin-antitoxin system AbiEi family antitoxin domain-containing protein [Nocardiopsis gilva]|uniref:type IV toxin-antitoxin system AbiEi family antitoxin domain-containing protein n=1 Tax=Nocardiopsis gilva TaxID=280236 RepID=UPI00037C345A|nr:type IV toxin-antitoxin system AbiEi family antitoxin domain-containing protein [Nocardiopsis gilva]